jgi:DNA-directed RNA polymerase subunit alpha
MGWKDITMPSKSEFDSATLTTSYGKLVMEPFERGYALTVGNALRRALLSSIEGAAPVSVKIEGVPHEFGTIPGIMEDVLNIILSVRQLVLRIHGQPPKTMRLSASGERKVSAADFEPNPEIEVLNPTLHIATLTEKNAKLILEVEIDVGRGFISAERNKRPDAPIGVIPLDANYSPVTRVRYDVENTRVGQITDFERLVMEIWTDGRVTPEKAVDEAAFILREHFSLLVREGGEIGGTRQVRETERIREQVSKSVEELELAVRTVNSLHAESIKTIGELVVKTEEDLLKFKNFGRKSLEEVKAALDGIGLALGMELPSDMEPAPAAEAPGGNEPDPTVDSGKAE